MILSRLNHRYRWSVNYGDFSRDRLQEEIADAFVLLAALATQFDIDIEEAVADKFIRKDGVQEWQSAMPRSVAYSLEASSGIFATSS